MSLPVRPKNSDHEAPECPGASDSESSPARRQRDPLRVREVSPATAGATIAGFSSRSSERRSAAPAAAWTSPQTCESSPSERRREHRIEYELTERARTHAAVDHFLGAVPKHHDHRAERQGDDRRGEESACHGAAGGRVGRRARSKHRIRARVKSSCTKDCTAVTAVNRSCAKAALSASVSCAERDRLRT